MASGEHDFSALVLRGAIGPMLIAHGANKVFGPGGLDGTTRWFDSLGLKPPWLHARLAAATELGAGALVTAGALHPWSEAAVIGLMTAAAATDHRGKGFFIFKGGWEYTAVVGAAAAALAGLGHGRLSFDHLIGPEPDRRQVRDPGRGRRGRSRRRPDRRHLSARDEPAADRLPRSHLPGAVPSRPSRLSRKRRQPPTRRRPTHRRPPPHRPPPPQRKRRRPPTRRPLTRHRKRRAPRTRRPPAQRSRRRRRRPPPSRPPPQPPPRPRRGRGRRRRRSRPPPQTAPTTPRGRKRVSPASPTSGPPANSTPETRFAVGVCDVLFPLSSFRRRVSGRPTRAHMDTG